MNWKKYFLINILVYLAGIVIFPLLINLVNDPYGWGGILGVFEFLWIVIFPIIVVIKTKKKKITDNELNVIKDKSISKGKDKVSILSISVLVVGMVSLVPFLVFFLWIPAIIYSGVITIFYYLNNDSKSFKMAVSGFVLALASIGELLYLLKDGF